MRNHDGIKQRVISDVLAKLEVTLLDVDEEGDLKMNIEANR